MSLAKKAYSLLQRDIFLFVANLLTGVIIARVLGPVSMGLWVILSMIPSYAESFGRLKFDIAAVYYLGKGKYQVGEVVSTLNVLALASSALIIAPIVWQIDWIYSVLFSKSSVDVKHLIYLVLPQIPLHFLYMNYSYLFIHREDVTTYNRMVIIQSMVSSLAGIILLVVFKLGLSAVLVASTSSILISVVYGIFKFGPVKPGSLINSSLVIDLFSYVYKLYIAGVVGHINTYVTNLIVALHLIPAQVAYFSMAQGKGQLLDKVPNAMSTILFPRISNMSSDVQSSELAARAFRTTLLILMIAGMLAYLLAKPLVIVLYGRAYLPLVIPLWIILPGLVLSSASSTLVQYFQGTGRADIIAKISFLPLCTQIAMALILVPRFGLVGAALAFATAFMSNAVLQIFFFLRVSQLSFRSHLLISRNDVETVVSFARSVLDRFIPVRFKRPRKSIISEREND